MSSASSTAETSRQSAEIVSPMKRGGPGDQAAAGSSRGRNTTAERAIEILLLFDDQHLELSVADISEKLGVPRSTIYRYLHSLRSYGFVEETSTGCLRLGPLVLQLAHLARRTMHLPDVARPIMRELSRKVGETVLLTRLSGTQVVCMERADESEQPLRVYYGQGEVIPMHLYIGASATVLLAFREPGEVRRILAAAREAAGPDGMKADLEALEASLPAVRTDGYFVTPPHREMGVRGIGVAVRRETRRAIGCLTVLGPAFRLTDDVIPEKLAAVQEAARAISERLREIDL